MAEILFHPESQGPPIVRPFERETAEFLLAGDHTIFAALREQLASATVAKRTGLGPYHSVFFTLPPRTQPLFAKGVAFIDDVRADLIGLAAPLEFKVVVRDGLLSELVGYVCDDDAWPEEPRVKRFYYFIRQGNGEVVETLDRDVAQVLSDVLDRQAEPVRPYLDGLPELWGEEHSSLVDRLVPDSGSATSVQGEVLRAALRLSAEFYRNGCGNWSVDPPFFDGFVSFLLTYLCDETLGVEIEDFVRQLLARLQAYGHADYSEHLPNEKKTLDKDLDKLEQITVAWCRHHPELIAWADPSAGTCGSKPD